jgi:hypothetical protein
VSWFTNLRILAFVRRGVRALEDIASSQRTLAQLAQDDWNARHAPRVPRRMEFGAMSQKRANAVYRQQVLEQEVAPVMATPEDED